MSLGGEEDGGDEVADEAQLLGGVEDGLGRKRREGAYVVLGARRRAASDQARGPQHASEPDAPSRGRARADEAGEYY